MIVQQKSRAKWQVHSQQTSAKNAAASLTHKATNNSTKDGDDFEAIWDSLLDYNSTKLNSEADISLSLKQSKQKKQPEMQDEDQVDSDDSTDKLLVGGVKIPTQSASATKITNSVQHKSHSNYYQTVDVKIPNQHAFRLTSRHLGQGEDVLDIDDILLEPKEVKPQTTSLFPKTLLHEAWSQVKPSEPRSRFLASVSLQTSEFNAMNASFNLTSKFFRPKNVAFPLSSGVGQTLAKNKQQQKEVPTCIEWFTKMLKTDERVIVCTTIDREIVTLLQKMQTKCREKKSKNLPEFLSVGFQFKAHSTKFPFDQADNFTQEISEPDGFDFRADQKQDEKVEVIDNELELLEYIRITETLEEMDTLTVSSDLVKDPERFLKICSQIAGTSFMRMSPELRLLNQTVGRVNTKMPMWLNAQKFNSFSKWIIVFVERAIWVHFNTYVKVSKELPLSEIKQMWVQTEGKLISFKSEILPYWTELSKKIAREPSVATQHLFMELEQKARAQIQVQDTLSQFNGGLSNSNNNFTSYDLSIALHNFSNRIKQLDLVDNPIDQLQFIQNLAQIKPAFLHDTIMTKLEIIFAQLLLAKKRQAILDGQQNGTSQNLKLQKKKQKRKEKQLLQKVEDSIAKDKQTKRDKEEAKRQRLMFMRAEKSVQSEITQQENTQKKFKSSPKHNEKLKVSGDVDVGGVRKKDLEKLTAGTPIPILQKGVTLKYVYPELPDYQESYEKSLVTLSDSFSDSSYRSDKSYNFQSNQHYLNKKIKRMGAIYSQLIPQTNSKQTSSYDQLLQELMSESPVEKQSVKKIKKRPQKEKTFSPCFDYACSDDMSSNESSSEEVQEDEVTIELPQQIAVFHHISYQSAEIEVEKSCTTRSFQLPEKLTKSQSKKLKKKQKQNEQKQSLEEEEVKEQKLEEPVKSLLIIRPSLQKPKNAPKVSQQTPQKAEKKQGALEILQKKQEIKEETTVNKETKIPPVPFTVQIPKQVIDKVNEKQSTDKQKIKSDSNKVNQLVYQQKAPQPVKEKSDQLQKSVEESKKKKKKAKQTTQFTNDPQLEVFAQLLQTRNINKDQLSDLLNQLLNENNSLAQKNEINQVQQQSPAQQLLFEQEYHNMVSKQIKTQIKLFEHKLDSVRKEREHMILIIDRQIRALFQTTSVKQYGSQANSLAVDSSDVDLAVTGFSLGNSHQAQIAQMNRLYQHVRTLPMLKQSEFIHTASVPVIKLRADLQLVQELMSQRSQLRKDSDEEYDLPENVKLDDDMRILNIDVTFDGFSVQGSSQENPQASGSSMSLAISSVHKIKELQMKYSDLRSIVLIVKKLLARYGLNKPYSGGLNSYSIVLMTSSFLQKFGQNNFSALSENLMEFFQFFGNYFDPQKLGMDGQFFFDLSNEQKNLQEHMWVLDIQNRENNTARTAFRIQEILQVFRNAYHCMFNELQRYDHYQQQQKTKSTRSPTPTFEVIKQLLA